MTRDLDNYERMIKGRITRTLNHSCGLSVELMHESVAAVTTLPIIQRMGVSLIVELGTSAGGFTKLLEDACPQAEIHTFDISDKTSPNRKFFSSKVRFYNEDVRDLNGSVLPLLRRKEKKLLYCDNGNKKKEVEMFHSYLNPGDFIGVHDWGRELFFRDVSPWIGEWTRIEWALLEEHGALSRFWIK